MLIAVIATEIVALSVVEVCMHIHLRVKHRWQALMLDNAPIVLWQQVRIVFGQHMVRLIHHDLTLLWSAYV